ncbi:hypothetical protein OXPF_39260 [Oxobacter pfennigii]|uniref:Uncharacterized protein n=1 Tax=Oxobacter pfennigii TaxID=36849 RepID=A0A0P8WJ61_9CLOT|nr:hypothetical protein [Oxobacter pfennigii]KPU42147.1 hypothetical protein OXPF_39260 [Oxobacter pfennigii]
MIEPKINKLHGITAASIERYLLLKGWLRDYNFKNKNLMVFNYPNSEKRIAFPANENYDDFFINLNELLQTISVFEQRSIEKIVKEILTVYFDRMEFRIVSTLSQDGKLPLDYAVDCIEGLKELILYSACAEQKAQPICFRATNIAKDYLESFKLAQTEVGSFVINIDIQVIDEQAEQMTIADYPPSSPFEHKIVERIYTAISQVNNAVEQKQSISDMATVAYETGITANMCDALMKMKPASGSAEIDTTIRYASALTQTVGQENHVTIKDHHFYVIDELAKIYRDKVLYQDVIISGIVKSLSKRDVEDTTEKTIRLLTKIDGQYRTIIMELSEEDYRIACDAHRDEQEVEVAGELDMNNRMWVLTKIEYFRIVNKDK